MRLLTRWGHHLPFPPTLLPWKEGLQGQERGSGDPPWNHDFLEAQCKAGADKDPAWPSDTPPPRAVPPNTPQQPIIKEVPRVTQSLLSSPHSPFTEVAAEAEKGYDPARATQPSGGQV